MKYIKYKTRLAAFILSALIVAPLASGCEMSPDRREEIETSAVDTTEKVAIHAGNTEVNLDEARYYAYTAQATYEISFAANGKDIVWSDKMDDKHTWEEGVKSVVLDDICRRECMYSLVNKYNVTLPEEDKKDIELLVRNYFEDTDKNLQARINISKERLQYIFEKDATAKMVEKVIDAGNIETADEVYEKWKEENTISGEMCWEDITFGNHIFTVEDIILYEDETKN